MPFLKLDFLGGFVTRLDGKPVGGFESDKARLLLAYLAIESGRPLRRESLAGLFWPESPEKRARQSLSQALYNLRILLGQVCAEECLEITPQDVSFHQRAGVEVDVSSFLTLVKEINKHAHPAIYACRTCQECLAKAASLYQGELLAGFSLPDSQEFEAWLREQRAHLQEESRKVLEELVRSHLKRGEHLLALDYAGRLVALDPLDEANQRRLLELLALTGTRAKALQQYTALKRLLADELGVEPEAETTELVDMLGNHFDSFLSSHRPAHNLPANLTPFIGREGELENLYWKLLDPACRLLTLLGLGGSGKTRLAIEVSRKILPAFPDGVFLVELGVLSSPHDLVPAIARTLGVRPKSIKDQPQGKAQLQDLVDHLHQKELLLILDSAEMVLEGAPVLSNLLQSIPGLTILATSRARLNLAGENLVQLSGLPFPVDSRPGWEVFPAVQLFNQTARRSNPDFRLSDQNASSAIQICKTLEGMPLAILLAAAWISAMPPHKILQEIQSSLEFLAGGWQDLPPRQKSLHAAFDYSWGLLWEEERAVLRQLAIFRQPFSDDQAKEVAEASSASLKALLDFCLLQRTSQNRLRLHDLVRQFAQAKLMESPEESLSAHTRLADLYLRRLAEWDTIMQSARQAEAVGEMDLEIENARLAWDWLVRQVPREGMESALEGALEKAHQGLCNYYYRRGQFQRGESACQDALSRIESRGLSASTLRLWARLASWQGHFWNAMGRTEEGLNRLNNIILEIEKKPWLELDLRWEQALAYFFISLAKVRLENELVVDYAKRSADLFIQCGDRWYAARALVFGAAALESLGRYNEQIQLSEHALELQTPDGDPELVHYIRYVLGCGYIYKGDHENGARIIDESISLASDQDEKMEIALKTIHQAVTHLFLGKFREALTFMDFASSIYRELGRPLGDENLSRYVAIYWGLGEYTRALEFAAEITTVYGLSLLPFLGPIYLLLEKYDLAQAALEKSRQAALETTNNRTLGVITVFLSLACYQNGDMKRAASLLTETLEKSKSGNAPEMSASLLVVAFYLLEQGDVEQAEEVFMTAIKNPLFGKSTWTYDFLGKRIELLAQNLPDEIVAAARARGQKHSLQELVDEWSRKVTQLTVFEKI